MKFKHLWHKYRWLAIMVTFVFMAAGIALFVYLPPYLKSNRQKEEFESVHQAIEAYYTREQRTPVSLNELNVTPQDVTIDSLGYQENEFGGYSLSATLANKKTLRLDERKELLPFHAIDITTSVSTKGENWSYVLDGKATRFAQTIYGAKTKGFVSEIAYVDPTHLSFVFHGVTTSLQQKGYQLNLVDISSGKTRTVIGIHKTLDLFGYGTWYDRQQLIFTHFVYPNGTLKGRFRQTIWNGKKEATLREEKENSFWEGYNKHYNYQHETRYAFSPNHRLAYWIDSQYKKQTALRELQIYQVEPGAELKLTTKDVISEAVSAAWYGNQKIIYRKHQGGVYVYDIPTKASTELPGVDKDAFGFKYNPDKNLLLYDVLLDPKNSFLSGAKLYWYDFASQQAMQIGVVTRNLDSGWWSPDLITFTAQGKNGKPNELSAYDINSQKFIDKKPETDRLTSWDQL